MFDIGAVELMVIAIVAIIVVGPKDLPGMLRSFGQFVSNMRKMAREFQETFEEAAKDTGIDDITKGVSDVKNFSVTKDIGKVFDPISEEVESVKSEIDQAGQKPPSSHSAPEAKATRKASKATQDKTSNAKQNGSRGSKSASKSKAKKAAPRKQPAKKPAARSKTRSAKAPAQTSS